MKYSVISSLEYGKGKVLLMCCRFNNFFTGNNSLNNSFSRTCFEWVSSKSKDSLISTGVVVNGNTDGGATVIDNLNKVNIVNMRIEDLTEYSLIEKLSNIVIFGIDNKISPVIRANIERYVKSGGGLTLSDINVRKEFISILDDISPVYCEDPGIKSMSGYPSWTDDGISSYLFDGGKNYNIEIIPINSVFDNNFGNRWKVLYVHDIEESTDGHKIEVPEIKGPVFLSSDYDIHGANFVGYYASSYKNGIFESKESLT